MQMPLAKPSLADFFVDELKKNGPMTKEELRKAAYVAGYFPAGDLGGRGTHATLFNIARGNRVVEVQGTYRLVEKAESMEDLL